MNNTQNNNHNDDWESLFSGLPLDTTPREEHRDHLKMRVEAAHGESVTELSSDRLHTRIGRYLMTHRAPQWTAAAIVIGCIIAVAVAIRSKPAFALDDIIDTIMNAKTARFKIITIVEGQPQFEMKGFFMAPNRFRYESLVGHVNISDLAQGKILSLDTKSKRAIVINVTKMPKNLGNQHSMNHFDALREGLRQATADPNNMFKLLGEREMDGRTVVGFQFKRGLLPVTIWADVKSKLPYRIETIVEGPPKMTVVMTGYEFNVELDEELFSIEVPDGFEEVKIDVDSSRPTEKDLVTALRMCCDALDGEFPPGLDTAASVSVMVKHIQKLGLDPGSQPNAEQMQEMMRISRGFQFPLFLTQESDAHYAGKGAKSGDAQRVVFWYKPADSDVYRVLYADFSMQESESAPKVDGAVKLQNTLGATLLKTLLKPAPTTTVAPATTTTVAPAKTVPAKPLVPRKPEATRPKPVRPKK